MQAIDFSGDYADPNHPNCRRQIKILDGIHVIVSGTDGDPECPPDGSGKPWNLEGSVNQDRIVVDFSPKGGPKNLEGLKVSRGIKWLDGNLWSTKVTPNAKRLRN